MSTRLKNILIILLLLICAGQGWLLRDLYRPALQAVFSPLRIQLASLDGQRRTTISLEFNQPVPGSLRALEKPAAIAPETSGHWRWANPYTLKFEAQSPLALNMQYTVTLDEAFADKTGGERTVSIKTGTFRITKSTLREQASRMEPGMIEIAGNLEFNAAVNPEDLLSRMHLREANGTDIDLHLETDWRSSTMRFASAPLRKTVEPRTLSLQVDGTLSQAGRNLPLGSPFASDIRIVLDPVLHIENYTPESDIRQARVTFAFSAPMTAEAVRDRLTVAPETDVQVAADGTAVTVSGAFAPGSDYTFTLAPGITAQDGATLPEAYRVTMTMPDLPPSADFTDQGMFLPRQGNGLIGLYAVNTDKVTLTVSRVFLNNLSNLFQNYGYSIFDSDYGDTDVPYHLGSEIFRQTYELPAARNLRQERTLNLQDIEEAQSPGLYKVNLRLPSDYAGSSRWILRTDIGLTAKRDRGGYVVWASSIDTLQALEGVQIRLVSTKNQLLGRGETNAEGLVRIKPVNNADELGAPAMIQAMHGQDFSFILLDRFQVSTTGLDVSGTTLSASGMTAYIYGKRDIYRPGETLEGTVLVRSSDLETPPDMPLRLEQFDPQGNSMLTRTLQLQNGQADFSLDIPDWALTGPYGLSVSAGNQGIGDYAYQVEAFIPDRISVAIDGTPDTAAAGQHLNFRVASRYLFGPPAAHLQAATTVRLTSARFAPKGYDNFVFGDAQRSFEAVQILDTEDQLDANGTLSASVTIPAGLTPPLALNAVITSRVQEQGGRGVSARRSVPVHVYSLYPGLRRPASQEMDPGKEAVFEFVTLAPDGSSMPHGQMTATLLMDRWQTIVRRDGDGVRYESVRHPKLISTSTIAPGQGQGRFSFVPPQYGSYRVRLADAGGAVSELSFYCGGWGYSPWAVENPARLELVPDKKAYQAGDLASIQIRSPFAGKALVTVEGNGVEFFKIVDMPGNTAQVHIPVLKQWQPNRHVVATLIRRGADIEPGTPGRAFGAIPLFVDSLSNKMDVQITAPAEVRPDTDLTVRLRTAPDARITVAVVDEGILQLAGHPDPDPFQHFYATRALDVDSYDNFALLFPHLTKGVPLAGGGDDEMDSAEAFMRTEGIRRVKPVTFWSGMLTADSQGQLTHTVHLPDFQGALRIVAVGNKGKSFGTGTAMTRVRTPLVLTPTLPRFLATGDEVRIPLTVRNDTPDTGVFTLAATVSGPAKLTALPENVELATGTETTVYATLACGSDEGRVTFSATVRGNGETASSSTDLDQRAPLPVVRSMESGVARADSAVIGAAASASLVPSSVRRTIRLSTLPVARFAGHLEYLLRYPYGCAEQTVSQAFPLLYFGPLAQALAPGQFTAAGPSGLVYTAIRRLQTMQTPDGGYAYWPGAEDSNPWVSAYVGHFLIEARQAGYTVPPRMIAADLAYLSSLNALEPNSSGHDLETACYALYVQALGGQGDLGSQDFVRATFGDRLRGTDRTLLAGAYFATGRQDTGQTLLKKQPEFDDERHETGGNLGSGLRDRALVALILLQNTTGQDQVQAIMHTVAASLGTGRFFSTQESGLALMALGRYLGANQDDRPFSGTLSWDRGTRELSAATTVVLRDLPTTSPVSLTKTPQDRDVYYTLTTSGTPLPAAYAPVSAGLAVQQDLLNRQGNVVDTQNIRQGDLLILRTRIRATGEKVDNVVVQSLLPAGLEVENPRLATTERLDWMQEDSFMSGHQDLRDDRILVFTDLPAGAWRERYSVLRAVTPGTFALPPVQAEAMYLPQIRASGPAGTLRVLETRP